MKIASDTAYVRKLYVLFFSKCIAYFKSFLLLKQKPGKSKLCVGLGVLPRGLNTNGEHVEDLNQSNEQHRLCWVTWLARQSCLVITVSRNAH